MKLTLTYWFVLPHIGAFITSSVALIDFFEVCIIILMVTSEEISSHKVEVSCLRSHRQVTEAGFGAWRD